MCSPLHGSIIYKCMFIISIISLGIMNVDLFSEKNEEVVKNLQCLGDITKDLREVEEAASNFMLAVYGFSQCSSLTEARVLSWQRKMRRNVLEPPKLKSLPPTQPTFNENVKRAHLAAAVMKHSLQPDPPPLVTTDCGWYKSEGFEVILPVSIPEGTAMAPEALIKLIKCGCKSADPCSKNHCTCRKTGLKCTFLCLCHASDDCRNAPVESE